jgi:hypothetical protein
MLILFCSIFRISHIAIILVLAARAKLEKEGKIKRGDENEPKTDSTVKSNLDEIRPTISTLEINFLGEV